MNIAGIIYESLNDGEGVRTVIFISGCLHDCEDCQNKRMSKFNYGKYFDKTLRNKLIHYIANNDLISGLTLSGGDPIYSSDDLIPFLKEYKLFTNKSVWLYTGFKYEDILSNPILNYVDVLVDGEFKISEFDRSLKFKGSSNQRIIDIIKTRELNKIIEYYKE